MKLSKHVRQIRATMALLAAQLEALEDEVATAPAPCEHPERERESLSTFEEPGRWMCKRCGHIGGEKAAEQES
jgi:hypothetical protein